MPLYLKRTIIWFAFATSLPPSLGKSAEISFIGVYPEAGKSPAKTQEIAGIRFTYPTNQEDLLELILPQVSLLREVRKSSAATEAATFRELLISRETETETVIKALLEVEELQSDFASHYADTLLELNRVLDLWETWAGNLSAVRLHGRTTAAEYWNEEAKILDFGHIRYSFASSGNVNMSILPPFVNRIGAGIDKLNPEYDGESGFAWDIGLYSPPGTSAKKVAEDISKLIPVLTDLQHEVAMQLGTKWIRYYLIEQMLRAEISSRWFNGGAETRVLVNGLARLYLDHFIRLTEPERVAILFPNLVHFPIDEVPESRLGSLFAAVETLDPFQPVASGEEEAASRVLMLGLLKASRSVEGGELPLQRLAQINSDIPEEGFDLNSFAVAMRLAYPNPEPFFSKASREVSVLMRNNALSPIPTEPKAGSSRTDLPTPPHYRSMEFEDLFVKAPVSLETALGQLAPEWSKELQFASEIIRKRFEHTTSPQISFEQEDYLSLADYGMEVSEEDVAYWIGQTRVDYHLEQAFLSLFDQPRVEVWFEEDLASALRTYGNTELYTLDSDTGEVNVNFKLSSKLEPRDGAAEKQNRNSVPSFPVVVRDSKVANLGIEPQIEAIREGDLLIHHLTSGAAEFSITSLSGPRREVLDEEESYFIVVHETVEGYLIRNVIGSPDRRWFCDGLSNWIAIRESDRRFGPGTGLQVFANMFPDRSDSLARESLDMLAWKALEYSPSGSISSVRENEGPYYVEATRILTKALTGKNAQFVKSWLGKIRETNWIRTNAGTVISAYDELTGGDLRILLESGDRGAGINSPQ